MWSFGKKLFAGLSRHALNASTGTSRGKLKDFSEFFFQLRHREKKLIQEFCWKFSTALAKLHPRYHKKRFEDKQGSQKVTFSLLFPDFEQFFYNFWHSRQNCTSASVGRFHQKQLFFESLPLFFIDFGLWPGFSLPVTTFRQGCKNCIQRARGFCFRKNRLFKKTYNIKSFFNFLTENFQIYGTIFLAG